MSPRPSPWYRRFSLTALSTFFFAGAVHAGETGERMRERMLRMTDFFDTMLPGTLEDHNMTLHFSPKFGDFRESEYVRYPVELRYGLGGRWELSAGLVPFGPNPFNSGRDHRWGPGEGKLGARYDLGALISFFDATTLALETRIPLGKPPIDLNDHYTHVRPSVAAARVLHRWPQITFIANLAYDRSVKLTSRGSPPPEVMRRNIIEVAPGLLYKPGEFGLYGEYRFRHISEENEWFLKHEFRLGPIWDIPLARSAKWKLPGKWQAELAYRVSHEEGRGTDHGVAARVSWRTTLKEVLNHSTSTPAEKK